MPEISRRQFAVYLVAVVLVVVLGGRALRADAGGGIPGASPAGGFTAQAEPGTGSGAGGSVGAGSGSVGVAGAASGAAAGASAGAGGAGAGGRGAGGATGAAGGGGVELSTPAEQVIVHVAGAVRHPGVYELAGGARVADALTKAGGGRAGADLDDINLAAKLTDGQQVLVTRKARAGRAGGGDDGAGGAAASGGAGAGGAAAGGAAAGAAPASVNVNQADVTALEGLDGVGPAIAQKIVDYRTQNGPFKSVDDLAQVSGIGPKKLEAMRAQVVL